MRPIRWITGWMTDFVEDVRFAVRSLWRTPGLAALVVATLALGIGMTATPFSMLDTLVFRPYPVPHPGGVVNLVSTSHDNAFDLFSYREYLDIRGKTRSYEGTIASTAPRSVGFSVGLGGPGVTPRVKVGMLVSGNYFRVLGVEPRLGRGFREDEDRVPGRDAVAVLGPDFWKDEFGGDPGVVGRAIRLNGTDFTVVGVAPDSFPGMQIFVRPDLYVPLAMAGAFPTKPQKRFFEDRDDRELSVKGRLRPGATLGEARSELALLARDFARQYPQLNRDRGAAVRTQMEMRMRDDDDDWKFGVIFSILALAVLLVACTNVAGLLLARGRTRAREIAVRLAIGAGRSRLVRLLWTESLVLALLGGLGGVAVGYGGIAFLQTFRIPSELPVRIPFRMDARVLLACLAVSVVSAFLCGLAPAFQSTRAELVGGLKAADAEVPGRRRLWGRNALVVAQVATSLMLLAAAFLMARGFRHSVLQATGFAKDHLLLTKLDPRLVQYDAARTQRFYKLLVERVREAPGVAGAALAEGVPLGVDGFGRLAFVPEGYPMPPDRASFTAAVATVDPGFLPTMGIPILRGRGFLPSDAAEAPRVAVVNEQLAKHYWPGADAVGRRIRLDGPVGSPVEIVGVARTVKYEDTAEKPKDFVYLPLAQHPVARMILLLRSTGDPLQLVKPVKDALATLDPNLPVLEMRTYEDVYRYQTVEGPAVAVELVGTLGAVGLLLAVAGLYGLVAYTVSRRTREIGIRMAIGAKPADILRLVMGKGLVLVGVGTALGLGMGFAVEKMMNAMLFNAGGVDLVAYAIVVPSLLLVTLLAAYVPGRSAARIAPTQALRHE